MAKHPAHPTRRLLRAARLGEISDNRLIGLLLEHLEEVCPDCAAEIAAERDGEIPMASYRSTVQRVIRHLRLRRHQEGNDSVLKEVPALVDSLRGRAAGQRLLLARNDPERYAHPLLVEALFHEARSALPGDPEASLSWAQTAGAITELTVTPYPPHRIRAMAYQGNAYRAAGDFDRARSLLGSAQRLTAQLDVADADVHAELHSFLGSLYTDLRRFDVAKRHLDEAAELYMLLDEAEAMARVLLQMSNLLGYQGRVDGAVENLRAALDLIGPRQNPRLYLAARLNLAMNLVEAGKLEAARDILVYDENLYEEHGDSHTLIRAAWLEGRIAAATGDLESAEDKLNSVRDHFANENHGFNAALACLELAGLYHRIGRWLDVESTAARAVRLFEANEIHREAFSALTLVHDSARRRRLTAETLRQVASFLEQARDDPRARFEIPT